MIFLKHQPFAANSIVTVKKPSSASGIVVPSDINQIITALNDIAIEYDENLIAIDTIPDFKQFIQESMYKINPNIIFVEVTNNE